MTFAEFIDKVEYCSQILVEYTIYVYNYMDETEFKI